jgi:hypothetical protein
VSGARHYDGHAVEASRAWLEALLAEQYDYLVASAVRFDEGYHHEWKRLAVALRVLVHDTAKSASLLSQLGIKDALAFLDTDARRESEPGLRVASCQASTSKPTLGRAPRGTHAG